MDKKTAYKIIQGFWDGVFHSRYRYAIKKWLISDQDETLKDYSIRRIWDETSGEADASTAQSLETFRINRRKKQTHKVFMFRNFLRYAAIFLLPLVTGLGVWNYASNHFYVSSEMMECYVPNGHVRTIILSDGTEVRINSGTSLLYPRKFGRENRKIYLTGEAYFKVTKDASHPFIVRAGNLNIQVLGTHFNVKAYSDQGFITTTLEEGAVKLYGSDRNTCMVFLHPNEQALFNCRTGNIAVNKVESEKYSSWTVGDLNFEQQPMNDILQTLEHHFDVHFVVDHTIDMNKEYTMNFKSYETLDDVLRIYIQVAGNISYKKEGRNVQLFIKGRGAVQ